MTVIMTSAWRGGTPRRLSNGLGIPLMTLRDRRLPTAIRRADLIVNWGTSRVFDSATRVLNFPSSVARAANKLQCLRTLEAAGVDSLEWTTSKQEAEGWIGGSSVIGHFDLHGHSGSGLELFKKGAAITRDDIKLFTRYFPKDTECRVLMVKVGDQYRSMYMEKVRCAPEKRAERGLDAAPCTYIRTWDNGWNFARNVNVDTVAVTLAARAMQALSLDIGAVDILKKSAAKGLAAQYRVGEINTAPGLEGSALAWMQTNLKKIIANY